MTTMERQLAASVPIYPPVLDAAMIRMLSWRMKDVTPYPAINIVLSNWANGLTHLLGQKIVALYLSFSLSYGAFVPERSDIDLEAVVQSRLTADELRWVEQLHRQIERECREW